MPPADAPAWLQPLASADQLHCLGWVVIHSLWQGAAVAATLAVVLRFVPRRSAFGQAARYALATLALFSLPVACAVTWTLVEPAHSANPSTASRETPEQVTVVTAPESPATAADRRAAASTASEAFHVLATHAATAAEPWLPLCAAAWLAGAIAATIRLAFGWSFACRLVATAATLPDARWQARLDRWKSTLGITAPLRLLASAQVDVPIVVGWLRPVVIWPTAAVFGMPPEQVDAILAHELAHIRRHDVLVNLLQSVIDAVFFHHPAAWWISAQVRAEREHCADELAIRALAAGKAGSRISYATALLALEERRQLTLAAAANGGSLGDRIRRLVGIEQPSGHPTRLAAAVVVIVAVAAALTTPPVGGSRQAVAAHGDQAAPTAKADVAKADDSYPDTNTITSLTLEQARKLAKDFPGVVVEVETKCFGKRRVEACLPLNGLKSLDAETAKVLAGYGKGRLLLNGLTTLNADTAKALARFKGLSLSLRGLTTLDVDAANALAEVKVQWLDLTGLTTFDADTAKALAEFKGYLFLDGLTSLDADTAKAFAEVAEFDTRLHLNGLTTLDAATAKALAEFKGGSLHLDGLTSLDADTAKALAEFQSYLSLNGLTSLNAETAKGLAFKRGGLSLQGPHTLDADTAKALAEFKGEWLEVNGLTTLSDDTAKALAEFKGNALALNGLISLNANTAKAFVVFRGKSLRFDGLTTLDAEAATALAELEGVLNL